MPKVFISHSSNDRVLVERNLIAPLRRHGIETWYSPDDILAPSDWEESLRAGLSACDWFLVVLSPNALKSEWVRSELHWAMEHRIDRIIPVLLEMCEISDFHLKLSRLQYIDFRTNLQAAQTQLLKVWNIDFEYKRQTHELRLVQGPPDIQGAIFPLNGKTIVGRNPGPSIESDCTFIAINNMMLSRRHAEFRLEETGCVRVTVLEGRNGIFVNRRQVQSEILHDGDEIRMGTSLFIYRYFPFASGETS